MFHHLKQKWKVDGRQLLVILVVFAFTGTATAYVSKTITSLVGMNEDTCWWWKLLLRLGVLVVGYQVILLVVALPFGQFRFFWNYEKKIGRWLGKLFRRTR